MSKRYSVDETWELCLKMWKWIDWHIARNPHLIVENLKEEWLEKNFGSRFYIAESCFLCSKGYNDREDSKYRKRKTKSGHALQACAYCPAVTVDKSFSCLEIDHHFNSKPRQFYAELKRLNKIRLESK